MNKIYARIFIWLSVLHFVDIEFEYQVTWDILINRNCKQSGTIVLFCLSLKIVMEEKFLWILCAVLAVSAARTILPEDLEALDEYNKIEPRIFENKILEAINSLKDFLRNGNPEAEIPPVDPYFLSYQNFDFIIKDTALKGYLQGTTFANFSRFEPVKVEFKLLPPHFKLEVFLDQLHVDGRYAMLGSFFNEIPVNGTGKFTSETKNITLRLNVKLTKANSSLQIKDIIFDFKVKSVKINYTNELVDDKVYELDEKLAFYILDQIQAKYVPPLLNMIKAVLNHFLLGFSFLEIFQIILEFLNKYKALS